MRAVFSLFPPLPFAHPPFPVSFFLPFSLSLSGPRGRQEAVTAWQRALLHINFFPSSAIPAPNAFAFHGHARRLFSAGTASRVASRLSSYSPSFRVIIFPSEKRNIDIDGVVCNLTREVVGRGRLFFCYVK